MPVRVTWQYDQGGFEVAREEPDYEVTDDLWREYERAVELAERLEARIRAEGAPISDDARARSAVKSDAISDDEHGADRR